MSDAERAVVAYIRFSDAMFCERSYDAYSEACFVLGFKPASEPSLEEITTVVLQAAEKKGMYDSR